MCSCSGSCNCNSTTIPKGLQGVPGTNGTNGTNGAIGPQGPIGETGGVGAIGSNGLNAFTTLTEFFVQPAVNSTQQINVVNTSWMAVNQIIFIGNSLVFLDSGGFYKVTSVLTLTSVVVMRMGWTIPSVTFRPTNTLVGNAGTIITPSGTIGPDGFPGSYIQESFWGIANGNGGSDDYKYGILVPEDSLINNYDALECQTIICINADSSSFGRLVEIKVSTTNNNDGVNAMVFAIPNIVTSGKPVTYAHINYKIQRISPTTFRSVGECFVGDESPSFALLTQTSSNNYICNSTTTITLDNSSNWSNNQYIVVVANDTTIPDISVRHHEIKVTRIKI